MAVAVGGDPLQGPVGVRQQPDDVVPGYLQQLLAKLGVLDALDPVVAELEAIVGAKHVRTDRGDVEPYARDATPVFRAVPDAVVNVSASRSLAPRWTSSAPKGWASSARRRW